MRAPCGPCLPCASCMSSLETNWTWSDKLACSLALCAVVQVHPYPYQSFAFIAGFMIVFR